jgi:hypothetical protein
LRLPSEKRSPLREVFEVTSAALFAFIRERLKLNTCSRLSRFASRSKIIHLALGFCFGDSVSLLNLAQELITFAGNNIKIVVGQFAPTLSNLAFKLPPISFDLIPIHKYSPFLEASAQ